MRNIALINFIQNAIQHYFLQNNNVHKTNYKEP
jgi:hypothetical protein